MEDATRLNMHRIAAATMCCKARGVGWHLGCPCRMEVSGSANAGLRTIIAGEKPRNRRKTETVLSNEGQGGMTPKARAKGADDRKQVN